MRRTFPNKPIRMLVPFAPGGAVGHDRRVLAQAIAAARLNWQFVSTTARAATASSRPPAVQKAPPDGYTLLMAHTGEFAVNPALFDNVPYELERDFAPITRVSDAPMLYSRRRAAPFNNFKELIAAAKAKPNTITFARRGNGSINHLAGEWLAQAAGDSELVHVPYKARRPAAQAVAAGDVDFGVMAVPGRAAAHEVGPRQGDRDHARRKKSPLDPSWATPRDRGPIPGPPTPSIWVGPSSRRHGHAQKAVIDRVNKK
jgi:tripartite-type tricarboxylate transporter receptor subunit TctC